MKKANKKRALLLLIPLMMVIGCEKTEHEHPNVITGIGTFNGKKVVVLNDVATDQERYFYFDTDISFYDYLHIDDTIKIITGGVYSGDGYYKDNIVLRQDAVGMKYNNDSIYSRYERAKSDAHSKLKAVSKQKTL